MPFFYIFILDVPFIIDALKSGIGESVSKFSNITNNPLVTYEVYECMDVISTQELKFLSYAPQMFDKFRVSCNITNDFNTSFKAPKIKAMTIARMSERLFFCTDDGKFLIKTLNESELSFLKTALPKYFSHFQKNPNSLLPLFSGLFYAKLRNNYNKELAFLVMSNIYPQELNQTTKRKYEINGNDIEGFLDHDGDLASKLFRLKDVKFEQDYPNGIQLSPAIYSKLMDTLIIDINFLKNLNVVNYNVVLVTEELIENSNVDQKSGDPSKQSEFRNGIVANAPNSTTGHSISVYIGFVDILQTMSKMNMLHYRFAFVAESLNFTNPTIRTPQKYAKDLYQLISKCVLF